MIIELLCTPLFAICDFVIWLLPIFTYVPTSVVDTINMLMKAMQFFPTEVWFIVLGNICFWFGIHFLIGLYKFVLSLVPAFRSWSIDYGGLYYV